MALTPIEVKVLSPQRLIFEGQAKSIILPGESGVFEIAPHHKRLLSRLLGGFVIIDNKRMSIKRGVVKAGLNKVTIIVEEDD